MKFTAYIYDRDENRDADAYCYGEKDYRTYYEDSLYESAFTSPDGFDESSFSIKAFQFA